MKRFTRLALGLLSLVTLVLGSIASEQGKLASVTLHFLDSFGRERTDCNIAEFLLQDSAVKQEFRDHFAGLTAEAIPYGNYRIRVNCADNVSHGPFYMSVAHLSEFRAIGAWLHRGDYVTGESPRLIVSVTRDHANRAGDSWVDIIGVYLHTSDTDAVDSRSNEAAFYDVVPGRYLILLLRDERLLCQKQVDLGEQAARLDFSIESGSCAVKTTSGIKLID
jgi:hypothetical protein